MKVQKCNVYNGILQGWRTYGMQISLGTWHSTADHFFSLREGGGISFAPPKSLYWEEYVYIYMYLTAHRMYMNYRCYHVTLRVKHFYTNQEQCEVSNGYLSLRRQPGSNWVNKWHWTKGLTISSSNRKWQQLQLLPNLLPHHTPRGGRH